MTEPPTIAIRRGSPTATEQAAVEAAVTELWLKALSEAADRPDAWLMAGRAEATRTGSTIATGKPDAWRLSGRLTNPHPTSLQPGRGDAR